MKQVSNFGNTVTYNGEFKKPRTKGALRTLLLSTPRVCPIGGMHSFVDISDADTYLDTTALNAILSISLRTNVVEVEAGITIDALEQTLLRKYSRWIYAVGSTRGQTVAGALAGNVNSPGGNYRCTMAESVLEITYFDTNHKDFVTIRSGEQLRCWSIHLGCLCGVIYSVKLRMHPNIRGRVSLDRIARNQLQEIAMEEIEKPELSEYLYMFSDAKTVSVMTITPHASTQVELRKREKTGRFGCFNVYNYDQVLLKYAGRILGVHRINKIRTTVGKSVYLPNVWLRMSFSSMLHAFTYLEFFVPIDCLGSTLALLEKLRLRKVAQVIQIRNFKGNNILLSGSYESNVSSLIFSATVKELQKYRYIIRILNVIGVRWHWGQCLDWCFYDGYIERCFSNQVRDVVAARVKAMRANVRPSLSIALRHRQVYTDAWTARFRRSLAQVHETGLGFQKMRK